MEIRDLIIRLNTEKKITFMISSHLLEELSKIATRYGFIHDGKLIEEISAVELSQKCSDRVLIVPDNPQKAAEILSKIMPPQQIHIYNKSVYLDSMIDRTGQINKYLVENGVKYTPVGGEVSVSLDADHQNCYITVQDTGIGIDEEEQSKIFERFYRIDKTRDRETGGTGLGLAITHSTIVLHNGSVKIISGEGQGATFIVRLPLKYQQS